MSDIGDSQGLRRRYAEASPTVRRTNTLQWKLLLPLISIGAVLVGLAVQAAFSEMRAREYQGLKEAGLQVGHALSHAAESVSSAGELDRFVAAMGAERNVKHVLLGSGDPLIVRSATRTAWLHRPLVELDSQLPGLLQALNERIPPRGACTVYPLAEEVGCILPVQFSDRHTAQRRGVVVVRIDAKTANDAIRSAAVSQISLMLSVVVVICLVAAALLHYVVLRPVRAITRATELRRMGDPTALALVLADDEMGMLARKLNQANAAVDATMQDLRAEKQATEELSLALRLRMRQSACLAEVLTLCQRSTLNEDALLQSIVELLPAACRFPDMATACVSLEQRIFQSAGFERSDTTLSLPIRVQGTVVGRVDVAYMRALPDADRVFLEEDRVLIDAISGAVGETLQRRRGERDLARSRGLLEGVGLSQSLFIEGRTPQVVFDQALNLLLEVTGSEYGFIGEVLRADTNKPYLRTFALTNIAWDDETHAFYAEHAPSGMEFHNLESLFGAVMTSEALVISNQPAVDPRRTGVPPGHPPLNAFMGVPIHAGGELVGMIGVANREGGYEPDMAQFLEPLLLTCGNLIIALRNDQRRLAAEAELRMHRDHLNDMVDEQTASIVAARDYAERANRSKSEFLANMSHELRTPLHAVMSFAQLGVDRAGTAEREKLAHYFGNIHKSGQRLLRLLNDLLDLAKLEAGKMRLDIAVHDLAEVIRDAVAESSALAHSKAIEIIVEHKGEPVDIACDRIRILQVVCNLLSNALKFSLAGSVVRLQVSPCEMRAGRRTDDQGMRAGGRIEVIDQGVGVPEDELDAIFEKFIQSSKTKSGAGGTGLGLAICREIVASHGGHIAARNNPTGGATFSVVLPAQVQGPIQVSAGAEESRTV